MVGYHYRLLSYVAISTFDKLWNVGSGLVKVIVIYSNRSSLLCTNELGALI